MHKNIDFTHDRDFPATKDSWGFMQEAYQEAIAALAASGGSNYMIISGVEVSGGNHTDGWVVILGELLPFRQSATGTYVMIRESVTQAPWRETGGAIVQKDTYLDRYVEFGTGVGQIAFAGFKRMELARAISSAHDGTGYLGNANSPLAADWAGSGTMTVFEKDQFQNVKIQGMLEYTGAGASGSGINIAICTLAAGYRPTRPIQPYLYFEIVSTVTRDRCLCRINTSTGLIEVHTGDLTLGEFYVFDLNFIAY